MLKPLLIFLSATGSGGRFRDAPCIYFDSTYYLSLVLAFTLCYCTVEGQTLDIGGKIPDVVLHDVINSSSPISLSDYRGKLLILDFWATWCSPCIALMPKTDSLQKVFADDVQFLPVTYESREKAEKLLSRTAALRAVSLPIATGDSVLRFLFPHRVLPHYVWIGPDGVVQAITGSEDVTPENIRRMLAKPVQLEKKVDRKVRFVREQPLLLNPVQIVKEDIRFSSVLTGYLPSLSSVMHIIRNEDGSDARFSLVNDLLQRLYQLAYSKYDYYVERNRVVLEVEDRSRFELDWENASRAERDEWMDKNLYCYEIMVPAHLSSDIFSLMRADLRRLFPEYEAALEKRKVKCLALIRTSDRDLIATKGDSLKFSFNHFGVKLRNCTIALLMSQINGLYLQHLETPIVDATGYDGNVDMELECTMSNVESIRQALKKYDLDLVEKEMKIEMLVIRDAHPKTG